MKIFQIGFNRCGTTSLHYFFKGNGLASIHWADRWLARWMHQNHLAGRRLLAGHDKFDFYSDMEDAPHLYAHILYYKLLEAQYPGSRFILNTRNKDKWLSSRLKFPQYTEQYAIAHNLTLDETVDQWSRQWDAHMADVLDHFKNKNNLLVFNIEEDDITHLISFFPQLNLNAQFWERKHTTDDVELLRLKKLAKKQISSRTKLAGFRAMDTNNATQPPLHSLRRHN